VRDITSGLAQLSEVQTGEYSMLKTRGYEQRKEVATKTVKLIRKEDTHKVAPFLKTGDVLLLAIYRPYPTDPTVPDGKVYDIWHQGIVDKVDSSIVLISNWGAETTGKPLFDITEHPKMGDLVGFRVLRVNPNAYQKAAEKVAIYKGRYKDSTCQTFPKADASEADYYMQAGTEAAEGRWFGIPVEAFNFGKDAQ